MSFKRVLCALLAGVMAVPAATLFVTSASAAEVEIESSQYGSDFSVVHDIKDGLILNCFDWTYDQIREELPNIAKSGFTSVQTSPAQSAPEGRWSNLYMPMGLSLGNALGTDDDLRTLCSEAERFGIKIIVDVEANHLNPKNAIAPGGTSNSDLFHQNGWITHFENRYEVTQYSVGLPDLNSENKEVQDMFRAYVDELHDLGVKGIRWADAKHIALPSEGCTFWQEVTENNEMWNYGEILEAPYSMIDGANDYYDGMVVRNTASAPALMAEYTKYMSVTDTVYSTRLLSSLNEGKVPELDGYWNLNGIDNSKIVYQVETPEYYSKGDNHINYIDQNAADRAWAISAALGESTAVYFSRPEDISNDFIQGTKGSTHFTSKEVAAVAKFHNDNYENNTFYEATDDCAVITREGGGAVIVKKQGSGHVDVPDSLFYLENGGYKDVITGNHFYVVDGSIEGNVGSTGIAVLKRVYESSCEVRCDTEDGTEFEDQLEVTLIADDNVINATYTTSEGTSGTFKNGKKILLGAATPLGQEVELELEGDCGDYSVGTTYKFKKVVAKTYPELENAGFVFDNTSKKWSTVNAYVYDDSNGRLIKNADWPGLQMYYSGDNMWVYDIDSTFANCETVKVIFNNGSEQIPAKDRPGFEMTPNDRKVYTNSVWKDIPEMPISVKLYALDAICEPGERVMLYADVQNASGDVNYTFLQGDTVLHSGESNSYYWTPMRTGHFDLKVIAQDDKNSAESTCGVSVVIGGIPPRIDMLYDNTTFTTETYFIKLKPYHVGGGYYTIDNGPNTSFFGDTTVEIGEGLIGNSYVTVNAKHGSSGGSTVRRFKKEFVPVSLRVSGDSPTGLYENVYPVQVNFGANVSAPQYNTMNLTLKAEGYGGTAPYTYEFIVDGQTIQADSEADTCSWKPTTAGVHTISCIITDSEGFKNRSDKRFTAVEDPNGELENTSTVNKTAVKVGETVTIEGSANNGRYPYKFAFYYKRGNAQKWTLKSDFGKAESATLTPSYADTYYVKVDAKDSFGNIASKEFTIKSTADDTFKNKSTVSKTDVKVNEKVTITGKASGGTAPYKYAFYYKREGMNNWTLKGKEFEDTTSVTLTPAYSTKYYVKVVAKDSTGASSEITKTINVTKAESLTNKSIVSAENVSVGTAVKLTGAASGGTAPYKYAFYYKRGNAQNFTTKSDFGKASSVTLTPAYADTYTVKIDVKDADGKVESKQFTIVSSKDLVNKSTLSQTSVTVGTSVKLTGAASGGTAPYQYAFYYKRGDAQNWTTKSDFGKAASATLTPAYSDFYRVKIDVKDANGKVESKEYTIISSKVLTNTSSVSATEVKKGTTVKITGAADGGVAPYQYAFYYKKGNAQNWTLKSDFGKAACATLTPSYTDTYTVKVDVKDANGTVKTKTFTITSK